MADGRLPPLRLAVLNATGQDVRRCAHCSFCADLAGPDDDLTLEMVLQLVVMNDEEVLTSQTVWSAEALETARRHCVSSLDVAAVLLALRAEAQRRGLDVPCVTCGKVDE
jgi:heterodisulfide reductase subunit C